MTEGIYRTCTTMKVTDNKPPDQPRKEKGAVEIQNARKIRTGGPYITLAIHLCLLDSLVILLLPPPSKHLHAAPSHSIPYHSQHISHRLAHSQPELLCPAVGNTPDEHSPWTGSKGQSNTDSPLHAIEWYDAESTTTNEDNSDLPSKHDGIDSNEEVVAMDTFKDVEAIVKTTITRERGVSNCFGRVRNDIGTGWEWLAYLNSLKICIQTNVLKTMVRS